MEDSRLKQIITVFLVIMMTLLATGCSKKQDTKHQTANDHGR